MNKYPKRPVDELDNPGAVCSELTWYSGHQFRCGCACMHARYLIEMSRRHPIMYWGWYRWWIPSLLHEDEHKKLDYAMKYYKKFEFRSFWADFALYHPVQFLVFLLSVKTVRVITKISVKLFSFPVKVISRVLKFDLTENSLDNIPVKNEFVEEYGNVPSDTIVIKWQSIRNV